MPDPYGEWSANVSYNVGDTSIASDGNLYTALINTIGSDPVSHSAIWHKDSNVGASDGVNGVPPDHFLTVTTDYTAKTGDYVFVDATANNVVLTLPSPLAGYAVATKRQDASSNTVMIHTPSGTIDGQGDLTLVQYEAVTLTADGVNWTVATKFIPNTSSARYALIVLGVSPTSYDSPCMMVPLTTTDTLSVPRRATLVTPPFVVGAGGVALDTGVLDMPDDGGTSLTIRANGIEVTLTNQTGTQVLSMSNSLPITVAAGTSVVFDATHLDTVDQQTGTDITQDPTTGIFKSTAGGVFTGRLSLSAD